MDMGAEVDELNCLHGLDGVYWDGLRVNGLATRRLTGMFWHILVILFQPHQNKCIGKMLSPITRHGRFNLDKWLRSMCCWSSARVLWYLPAHLLTLHSQGPCNQSISWHVHTLKFWTASLPDC